MFLSCSFSPSSSSSSFEHPSILTRKILWFLSKEFRWNDFYSNLNINSNSNYPLFFPFINFLLFPSPFLHFSTSSSFYFAIFPSSSLFLSRCFPAYKLLSTFCAISQSFTSIAISSFLHRLLFFIIYLFCVFPKLPFLSRPPTNLFHPILFPFLSFTSPHYLVTPTFLQISSPAQNPCHPLLLNFRSLD